MAATVKVSPIELFVKAYLNKNKRVRSTAALNLLRKASVYLNEKIESTCCDDGEAVINLYTRFDDEFTKSLQAILQTMPRKGHLKSLRRAKDLIDDYIAPACCIASNMEYTFTETADDTVTSDGVTEETYDVTLQVEITGPYVNDILKIEFFVDGELADTTADPTDFPDYTFTTEVEVPISGSVEVDYYALITYKGGSTKQSDTFTTTITDDFVE